MTPEEIKQKVEVCYKQIKDSENRLAEIRKECLHTSSFEGNYSYRVGTIDICDICSFCGKVLSFSRPFIINPIDLILPEHK